jgi:hypothetical protein
MRDGGKGDKQRPLHVTEEQFNANWDTIFKKPQDFFDKAKEVAKQIDNDEYHAPED